MNETRNAVVTELAALDETMQSLQSQLDVLVQVLQGDHQLRYQSLHHLSRLADSVAQLAAAAKAVAP